jgi:hypothetical protein
VLRYARVRQHGGRRGEDSLRGRAGYDRRSCLIMYRHWRRRPKSPSISTPLPLRSPKIHRSEVHQARQQGALPVVRHLGMVRPQHVSTHRRSETAAMSDAADLLAQALRDLINEAKRQPSSGSVEHHPRNELLHVSRFQKILIGARGATRNICGTSCRSRKPGSSWVASARPRCTHWSTRANCPSLRSAAGHSSTRKNSTIP